jgi:dipeptidyl aminopeptidase/acylaminoacyl peptidase
VSPSHISSALLLALTSLAGIHAPVLAARPGDGDIVKREPYLYPAYAEAKGIATLWTQPEYEATVRDSSWVLERITYLSDSLKVIAYAYHPRRAPAHPLRAIVFNRGSYLRDHAGFELAPLFHRLAADTFVVLAPLYRQSDGGEGRDEVGGADVDDLLNMVPLARSLGFVDLDNLFLYGESRGGAMVYQALRERMPVRAAAVFGAFTDFGALIDADPKRYGALVHSIWPNFDAEREAIVTRRSAIRWSERLETPVLIMQGGADRSVDPAQSLALAQELQKRGREYELVIYAGDNHVLARNHEDRDARTIRWFRQHLK